MNKVSNTIPRQEKFDIDSDGLIATIEGVPDTNDSK